MLTSRPCRRYGRLTRMPTKKTRLKKGVDALLLVDVLNDLEFVGGERVLPWAQRLVRPLLSVCLKARRAGIPVIYANDNFGLWRGDARAVYAHCTRAGVRGRAVSRRLKPARGRLRHPQAAPLGLLRDASPSAPRGAGRPTPRHRRHRDESLRSRHRTRRDHAPLPDRHPLRLLRGRERLRPRRCVDPAREVLRIHHLPQQRDRGHGAAASKLKFVRVVRRRTPREANPQVRERCATLSSESVVRPASVVGPRLARRKGVSGDRLRAGFPNLFGDCPCSFFAR